MRNCSSTATKIHATYHGARCSIPKGGPEETDGDWAPDEKSSNPAASARLYERGVVEMRQQTKTMRPITSRSAGFTLVEIMIVVAIIGLLAAIAIPNFAKARETANRNACVANLRQIDGAKDLAAMENGLTDGGSVDALVGGYLKGGLPTCPVGRTPYSINVVGTPPTCASPAAATHNAAYTGTTP